MHAGVPLVLERRDRRVEAAHFGHAVVVGPEGRVAHAWGDPAEPTYWRSAAKPLQALSFVASGAMDASKLDASCLALACGSHSSEPAHVATALRMLAAAGLTVAALQCGVHRPLSRAAGPEPAGGWTASHNNCSGKHAAMLCTCAHLGLPTASYLEPAHALQRQIRADVERAAGLAPASLAVGVDGCGVPAFHAPLDALARAFRWLAVSEDAAARRVLDAMARYPFMVGGTGRLCTALPEATAGRVVGKTGAQGVYAAVDRVSGAALAVKVMDGSRAAAEMAAVAIAARAGWLRDDELERLDARRRRAVTNHVGRVVGDVVPADFP